MSRWMLIGLTIITLSLSAAVTGPAQDADQTCGCEANPTGNPIGGGEGYSDIHETGDFVVTNREQLIEALKEAKPGQVVFLPDGVEVDLTGQRALSIGEGITLAGTRGKDGSAGARLFSKGFGAMFNAGGDNVRLTGLRFEGAYAGTGRIAGMGRFISVDHCNATVDNCEICNFTYCGIGVGRGALKTNIHHNYIHHCQRSGFGYGVSIWGGGDVHIIANKFDYCRHHVASTGSPGTGYEAAWNLIMENAIGSHFDMHGGRDRGDATDIAGDWMHIHHNTFLSTHVNVGIRGTPSDGADIHSNWFSRPLDKAVRSTGNTRAFNNAYGPDRIPQEHAICFADSKRVECAVEQCNYCPEAGQQDR